MKKNAIIIFLKYPELGKVKTRLASTTSERFALDVYKCIAEEIFKEIYKVNDYADAYMYYSTDRNVKKLKNWINLDFYYEEQKGDDLGHRISNAFNNVFQKGYNKVIIIGSDIPDVTADIIKNAFYSFKKFDVVISPSDDGGYSLLGARKLYQELFENIEWSTNLVFEETIRKINSLKLTPKILKTLNDIDTKEELIEWMNTSKNLDLVKKVKLIAEKEKIIL